MKLKIDEAVEYTVIEKRETSDPLCLIVSTIEAGDVAVSAPDRPEVFERLQLLDVPLVHYQPADVADVAPTTEQQLDLERRRRARQKSLVDEARLKALAGDHAAAVTILLEAIEPTEDQMALDARIEASGQ